MKYIKAGQFQSQSSRVQRVLLDWWTPEEDDLFQTELFGKDTILGYSENSRGKEIRGNSRNCSYYKNEATPLFTEGQLREFIEDKTKGKLEYHIYNWEGSILIKILDKQGYKTIKGIKTDETDLLQAYWHVVCNISKEEI